MFLATIEKIHLVTSGTRHAGSILGGELFLALNGIYSAKKAEEYLIADQLIENHIKRFFRITAIPNSPKPSNARVAGSGTAWPPVKPIS